MLLDSGAGADHPFYLPVGVTGLAFERVIFVTPLCAARMKRRSAVESLLLAAGAQRGRLHLGIPRRPHLARADARGRSQPGPGDRSGGRRPRHHTRRARGRGRAGRSAAAHPRTTSHIRFPAMCGRCAVPPHRAAWRWPSCCWHTGRTRHGSASDAGSFTPSSLRCWPAGARRSTPQARGSAPACTGNQGRKDDPEYVRALLRHGARATDRRTGDYRKARPASGPSTRQRCTTPPGQASCGPSRCSSTHGADPDARDSRRPHAARLAGTSGTVGAASRGPAAARDRKGGLMTAGKARLVTGWR